MANDAFVKTNCRSLLGRAQFIYYYSFISSSSCVQHVRQEGGTVRMQELFTNGNF